MAPFQIEFHPFAADELLAAHKWYEDRSRRAAAGFFAEVDRAVLLIAEGPERWPLYVRGTRRFLLLRRYPFAVVCRMRY